MTTTELIPFHGDTLQYLEVDGVPFVAIKPICERLGLAWEPQRRRLSAEKERWGTTIRLVPSGGGEQETICLPINRIAAWLFSIQVNKVAEPLREPLTRYQIEAADVLDRHFRQRRDDQSEEVEALKAMLQRSHAHLLVAMQKWAKIKLLHEADIWRTSAARRLSMSDMVFSTHVEEMQRCGILPAGPWEAGNSSDDWFSRLRWLQYENSSLKERVADAQLAAFDARQALPLEDPVEEEAEPREDEAEARG